MAISHLSVWKKILRYTLKQSTKEEKLFLSTSFVCCDWVHHAWNVRLIVAPSFPNMTISQLFVHHVWARSFYFSASSGMMKFSGWKEKLFGSSFAWHVCVWYAHDPMSDFNVEVFKEDEQQDIFRLTCLCHSKETRAIKLLRVSLAWLTREWMNWKVESEKFPVWWIRWNSLQKTWVLFSLFHILYTHQLFTFPIFLPFSLTCRIPYLSSISRKLYSTAWAGRMGIWGCWLVWDAPDVGVGNVTSYK